jgi:hypothetical protein
VTRLLALACLAACTQGAPPGFSGAVGDRWTFPLVGALEDGLLVTPVSVNSQGPFLFAIDPDAAISVIDGELVKAAGLRTFNGPHRLDETDTQQPRIYAELIGFEIGTLIIERRDVIVVKPGTFDVSGRRIHGVIGRDVLAESTVFGFDRDHGIGFLTTVKAFKPPAEAIEVKFEELRSQINNAQVLPVSRRIAQATINDELFAMHLDLGAVASQLRETQWERAKLQSQEVVAGVIDEVGTVRRITRASSPVTVTLGAATSERVGFIPYDDRRWPEHDLAGTLGLNFFAPYSVWLHLDTKTLYLRPRREVPYATRAGRWESGSLQKCTNRGCITVRLVDPLAGKPPPEGRPHPGVVLSITREERAGGMGLEVMLEASGKPELPRLIVNLPPHVDRLFDQLVPEFLGTTLVVRDASPYPRDCPSKQGCVDKLAR